MSRRRRGWLVLLQLVGAPNIQIVIAADDWIHGCIELHA